MAGPLVKSVSPMTRVSSVVSTIDEVVRGNRPQADRVGRIRLVGPGPLRIRVVRPVVAAGPMARAACPVHEPLLGQDAENLLQVVPAERLGAGERQLERRALDVIDEDVQVVGIDQRPLGRAIEEIRRMPDDELIERRAARHHDRGRLAGPAPRAAGTLPRRRDRSRIPGHDRDVERADVDAELQRVGGHDGAHAAFPQPLLDLAAPVRQIAASISADASRALRARLRNRPSDRSSGSRSTAGSARTRSAGGSA